MTLKCLHCRVKAVMLALITYLPMAHSIEACEWGGPTLQLGWFTATQGKSQHVNIEGLIGDDFKVRKSSDQNIFVGIGYYFDGLEIDYIAPTSILFGINAFYLAPTTVKGRVVQEGLFTNLSYHYSSTNYPIYFAAKALIHCGSQGELVIDAGIGPNFTYAHHFKERSLDGGITNPDHIFSNHCAATFSATAGIGWRIDQFLGNLPLEVSYRFFYLGEGKLKKANSQVKNNLYTGNSYGNALCVSVSL